jgi:quaternary ammonium compound-resistance protein SugE
MPWILLAIAGLFEVGWATAMKYSEGFSRPVPSLITLVLMTVSIWLLSIAMKSLPVGTAYAVWTGIGAVGALIVGVVFLHESASLLRLGSAALIVAGIAGLRLFQA